MIIKILRFIAAIPATILFIPIAIILCSFVSIFILFPEMIADIFEEVSGRTDK